MCVNGYADRCGDCMDCVDESGKTPAQKLLEAAVAAEKAPKCSIGRTGSCMRYDGGDMNGIQGCSLCSNQEGLTDVERVSVRKAYEKEARLIWLREISEDDDVLAYTNDGQNDLPDGNFR